MNLMYLSSKFQGNPYPDDVANGVDAVMQFAINKLNFQPENIMLFAWSIGGYALSWASMNYPDVKGAVSQIKYFNNSIKNITHTKFYKFFNFSSWTLRLTMWCHWRRPGFQAVGAHSSSALFVTTWISTTQLSCHAILARYSSSGASKMKSLPPSKSFNLLLILK